MLWQLIDRPLSAVKDELSREFAEEGLTREAIEPARDLPEVWLILRRIWEGRPDRLPSHLRARAGA